MDDLIKRLESYRPISEEWGDREHHTICDEAATALAEAQAQIARLEAERSDLALMGLTLQGWTQHDVLVNHEGAFQAINVMADRLIALSPKPAAPSA